MRILITGADGQLGRELQSVLAGQTLELAFRPQFDLLRPDAKERVLSSKAEVVIHAASFTDVDGAERDPELAMAVNAVGTEQVARAAAEIGARLLYLSTDYVFDGVKRLPYSETDEPNPINAYGRSKLEGERLALTHCPSTLVVRTSWLYSRHGNNFVKTIMRLAREQAELRVVGDQRGCPTHAGDLAAALARILHLDLRGIVHAAGSGDCSWYEFARAIVAEIGLPVTVRAISTSETCRAAPRPAYTVLANRRLAELGIVLPHWKDALTRFMHAEGGMGVTG